MYLVSVGMSKLVSNWCKLVISWLTSFRFSKNRLNTNLGQLMISLDQHDSTNHAMFVNTFMGGWGKLWALWVKHIREVVVVLCECREEARKVITNQLIDPPTCLCFTYCRAVTHTHIHQCLWNSLAIKTRLLGGVLINQRCPLQKLACRIKHNYQLCWNLRAEGSPWMLIYCILKINLI